jgi:ankyrin repeat protein
MKKSIVYLGMALLTITNAALASTSEIKPAASASSVYVDATPLCTAISKGDINIVKKFVEYGADVNERSNDMTPLMIAARYNNVEIIEFLLSKGAILNTKNESGYTALKYATISNARDAEALLKQKGAKK